MLRLQFKQSHRKCSLASIQIKAQSQSKFSTCPADWLRGPLFPFSFYLIKTSPVHKTKIKILFTKDESSVSILNPVLKYRAVYSVLYSTNLTVHYIWQAAGGNISSNKYIRWPNTAQWLKVTFQHSSLISTAVLSVIPRHFLKKSKLFFPNGLVRMSANYS